LVVAIVGSGALVGCGGATTLLVPGKPAPDLAATDQNGRLRRIGDERGHPLVVYFYPKDGTPGCTKEACAFRDAWDRYQKAGVQIFGVSSDDAKSHEQFAKEQKLPFPILADPSHAWSNAFGVSTTLGMDARVSFLIDASGNVAKTYLAVDPGIHADEVLRDAAATSTTSGAPASAAPTPRAPSP
jgi:peroxiredoxin Q/BCP